MKMATSAWGKEESFWSVLEKNCVELQKKHNLLHKFLQSQKGTLLLLEMVLHWIREPDVLCVTERRTENVNLFVLDVANMYVLNTRTLSASAVLGLILLLLLFLSSFVFICKCIQGLYYYLCLFASFLRYVLQFLFIYKWFVLGIFMWDA